MTPDENEPIDADAAPADNEWQRPRLPPIADPVEAAAESAVNDAAKAEVARQDAIWRIKGVARTVVRLASELGGQDPRHTRPSDAMAEDNITSILIYVMDSRTVDMPAAFRAGSAAADMARGAAVAKAAEGTSEPPA